MSLNKNNEEQQKIQNGIEKSRKQPKTVQKIDLSETDICEIEYSGDVIITTKKLVQSYISNNKKLRKENKELLNKIIGLKDVEEKYLKSELNYEKSKKDLSYEKSKNKSLENELKILQEKFEREKRTTMELSKKLEPFIKAQSNIKPKKQYLDEKALMGIYNFMKKYYSENGKLPTVKLIHEYVQFKGREMNNEKYINISYETVRTAVADLKNRFKK